MGKITKSINDGNVFRTVSIENNDMFLWNDDDDDLLGSFPKFVTSKLSVETNDYENFKNLFLLL